MKTKTLALALSLTACGSQPVPMDNCAEPDTVALPNMAAVCAKAGSEAEIASSRIGINNLIVQGNVYESINSYEAHSELAGEHDFAVIQQMCLSILHEASRGEAEEQALAIFGAGISQHERLLPLLEEAATSKNPQIQLAGLQFLANAQNTRADHAINRAIGSRFLITRLEAIFHLARKRYPTAGGQIDALMAKAPPELRQLFPQLYAQLGTPHAQRRLRHLLMDERADVRIATIQAIARGRNDALLPELRSIAKQIHPAQREACATAFGLLEDEKSVAILEEYLSSNNENVRLAALTSLYKLGRYERLSEIKNLAKQGNHFAITALAEMPGSENCLAKLCTHPDIHIRANASIALLQRRDPRCCKPLMEFLLTDERDLGLQEKYSVGRGLKAWRIIPSAQHNFRKNPAAYEISSRLKDQILIACMDLPTQHFLNTCEAILATQEIPRIPTVVRLLENEQSNEAITLLKTYSQRPGAPFTRHACKLALYRMDEPGPHKQDVQKWALEQCHNSMISLSPILPWEIHHQTEPMELTPNENSKLLFETLQTLAQEQNHENISILLEALRDGNHNNKPIIAGLLLRTTL